MSGQRSKSVRERLAQSMKREPKGPKESNYGDIILFGMQKVGKTSIVDRFVNNYFSEKYTPSTSQLSYQVSALIQCENDKDPDAKKTMVFKKSFKKSVMGKSRPLKPTTTMKRVLTTNRSGDGTDVSSAYMDGKQKGLKSLQFTLIDTADDVEEMGEFAYQALISHAKGFFLVCSFDVEGSLEYIKERFEDIKRVKNLDETPILFIANKDDIDEDDRLWPEYQINELAAQLRVKYCTTSLMTKEGCGDMVEIMLNEINMFAETEEYLQSLPEDYAYYDKRDERDMGEI